MDRVIEQAIPMDAIIRHVAFDSFGNATFFSFKESNKRREEAVVAGTNVMDFRNPQDLNAYPVDHSCIDYCSAKVSRCGRGI